MINSSIINIKRSPVITTENLASAFQKLKSYYYFDNSLLNMREQILHFENNCFIESLERLASQLNSFDLNQLNHLFDKISFVAVPKTVSAPSTTKDKNSNFYINRVKNDSEIRIKKVNLFIDCPIEIHIISVLFLEALGPFLEEKIGSKNYGNRLAINSETQKIDSGYRLFKPYFEQYKSWRDNCIKVAKTSLDSGSNVAILNIDLKSFYYSCNFDFKSIYKSTNYPYDLHLISIIEKTHAEYNKKIKAKFNSIPIGLLSSGPLANFYLSKFDSEVLNTLNPIYYGRYVDDILIAVSINNVHDIDEKEPTLDFFEKYFIRNKIFEKETSQVNTHTFKVCIDTYKDAQIIVQNGKILLHLFDSRGSASLLNKIIDEINRNTSEFRFLPENLSQLSFDESSHSLIYKDSSNSIRNIQEFNINKFEISKFFARLNMLSGLTKNDTTKNQTFKEIQNFFRCGSAIELYNFWEKAITAYVLNKKAEELKDILKQINSAISHTIIDLESEELFDYTQVDGEKLTSFLKQHLKLSLSQATSLNILFLQTDKIKTFLLELGWCEEIVNIARVICNGHYIRHHLVIYPVFNFIKEIAETEFDYTARSIKHYLAKIEATKSFAWTSKTIPRFIHFHELQMFFILKDIVEIVKTKKPDGINSEDICKMTCTQFKNLNRLNMKDAELPKVFKSNAETKNFDSNNDLIRVFSHEIPKDKKSKVKKSIRFGIVNMEVSEELLLDNLLYDKDLTKKAFFRISSILNESNKNNTDYTVFPECSIPANWLPLFVNESKRKESSYFFGLEHFDFKGMVFNITVGVFPFKTNGFTNAYTNVRVKNLPSHEEKRVIQGNSKLIEEELKILEIFTPSVPTFDLVNHDGYLSTLFNCFELSDVTSRAIFKSKIDFLLAIENNKDTNYFSSIVDSSARDLHCFVIQVNNSKYGDSRITQPSKTEIKDITKIKGGKNISLIIENIEVDALRRFQRTTYELQRENKNFKSTPARFKANPKR